MSVTALGKRYAVRIHDGTITLEDVHPRRQQDVRDSFIELYGATIEEVMGVAV